MQNDKVQRKEHSKMEEINSELKLQRFQVLFGKKWSLTSVVLKIIPDCKRNGGKRWRENKSIWHTSYLLERWEWRKIEKVFLKYWDEIYLIVCWQLPEALYLFIDGLSKVKTAFSTFSVFSIWFLSYVEDGVIFRFHSMMLHIGPQMLLTCVKLSYYFNFFYFFLVKVCISHFSLFSVVRGCRSEFWIPWQMGLRNNC